MKQYWGGGDLSDDKSSLPKWLFKPKEQGSLIEIGYLLLAHEHLATPPDSPSADFKALAYGLEVYMKTAMCMAWLEQASGTANSMPPCRITTGSGSFAILIRRCAAEPEKIRLGGLVFQPCKQNARLTMPCKTWRPITAHGNWTSPTKAICKHRLPLRPWRLETL